MGKCMWLVVLDRQPRLVAFTEMYTLFEDEEQEQALEWARRHGYESMMPLATAIGSLNMFASGDISVSIIRILVR